MEFNFNLIVLLGSATLLMLNLLCVTGHPVDNSNSNTELSHAQAGNLPADILNANHPHQNSQEHDHDHDSYDHEHEDQSAEGDQDHDHSHEPGHVLNADPVGADDATKEMMGSKDDDGVKRNKRQYYDHSHCYWDHCDDYYSDGHSHSRGRGWGGLFGLFGRRR